MIENVATWIGGIISVTAVLRAIAAAGDRRKRQREFWSGILSPEELKSNLVVCGGRRSAFADQVRGGIHSKGTSALIELILPLVLQTLYPFQKFAGNIMEQVSFGGADRIDNLGTLVKKAFTTGSRPPILFVEKLRCGEPRLLL
jgi:hypothetical protein